jgi:hypothetical protein
VVASGTGTKIRRRLLGCARLHFLFGIRCGARFRHVLGPEPTGATAELLYEGTRYGSTEWNFDDSIRPILRL